VEAQSKFRAGLVLLSLIVAYLYLHFTGSSDSAGSISRPADVVASRAPAPERNFSFPTNPAMDAGTRFSSASTCKAVRILLMR